MFPSHKYLIHHISNFTQPECMYLNQHQINNTLYKIHINIYSDCYIILRTRRAFHLSFSAVALCLVYAVLLGGWQVQAGTVTPEIP